MKTDERSWRVMKVQKSLLENFRALRDSRKVTTTELLATAVESQLPELLGFLAQVGIRRDAGERQAVRWSLTNETLSALEAGSQATGLPMTALLRAALTLATGCKAQNKPAAKTQKKATRKAGKRGAK